jgi:hypothetical protein
LFVSIGKHMPGATISNLPTSKTAVSQVVLSVTVASAMQSGSGMTFSVFRSCVRQPPNVFANVWVTDPAPHARIERHLGH